LAAAVRKSLRFHFSTAYSGLKEIFPNANIQLVEQHSMGIKNQFYLTENGNEEGLNVELFNNKTLEGTPEVKATTKTVDFKTRRELSCSRQNKLRQFLGTTHRFCQNRETGILHIHRYSRRRLPRVG
jgi:hypothetical protein